MSFEVIDVITVVMLEVKPLDELWLLNTSEKWLNLNHSPCDSNIIRPFNHVTQLILYKNQYITPYNSPIYTGMLIYSKLI